MALDVYVIPLWRFKAGIFKSPIEEVLGIVPTTISLSRPSPLLRPRPPWHLRFLAWLGIIKFIEPEPPPSPAERYEKARQEIDALKEEMSRLTGVAIDWQDVGESVYGEQFHGHTFLKTFALWCDHRDALPEFDQPPEGNYYKHSVRELPPPEKRRFPTLTSHSLYTGYLLPVPFEGVHKVEPFKVANHWEFFHDVASIQNVILELTDLESLTVEIISSGGSAEYLERAKWAREWSEHLRKICELGLEHGLPVIFHG